MLRIITKLIFSLSLVVFLSNKSFPQQKSSFISGNVYNSVTKEPLENCNITLQKLQLGTTTNKAGYFKLLVPVGTYKVKISYIGYYPSIQSFTLSAAKRKIYAKIFLSPQVIKEDEIQVIANKEEPTIKKQEIKTKDIQLMPTINSDVLRSVQILSGVSTNNELTSGYNVRGGSYDENLIYLNGYEIYRPFLLRTGVEENQSLINPDMVSNLTFYNGTFPAKLGDRMSSALEVQYKNTNENQLHGSVRADFLNFGLNLKSKYKKLNWNIGLRYAYPTKFLNSLQTRGDYEPSFSDFQIAANYKITHNSVLEFLGIYADNKFNFVPKTWNGNFNGFERGDQRGISIDFLGKKNFGYITQLYGVKYKNKINNNLSASVAVSKYLTNEEEKFNTINNIYYNSNPFNPSDGREFLKSQFENGNNFVKLNSLRFKTNLRYVNKIHSFNIGVNYKLRNLKSQIDESFNEKGEETLLLKPYKKHYNLDYNLNSFSLFAEDNILIGNKISTRIGLRFLRYTFSKENLISPRFTFSYKPSLIHNFTFSWGYYYQPPFINELRSIKVKDLKSQKAIHYVFGWQYRFRNNLTLKTEIYYKDLHNLIPFYFDEFKMIYVEKNNREGFAKGIDIMIEGELVDGLKSWFGYSYLDSQERKIGAKKYQRRLFDQTHTLQIFFQDKMGKHKNIQSHLRFLAGSGFLYYNRYLKKDPATNKTFIAIDYNNPFEYLFYLRVDMGLSASFKLGEKYKLLGIVEILNIFNRYNAGAYQWIQALKDLNTPLNIPQILSKRFLNLKIKLIF